MHVLHLAILAANTGKQITVTEHLSFPCLSRSCPHLLDVAAMDDSKWFTRPVKDRFRHGREPDQEEAAIAEGFLPSHVIGSWHVGRLPGSYASDEWSTIASLLGIQTATIGGFMYFLHK
jgi:hypothetical protein